MNREETKEAIKVMQGFVDGETVDSISLLTQTLLIPEDVWSEVSDDLGPAWAWNVCKYRLKPKPKYCACCGGPLHVANETIEWRKESE